TVVIFRKVFSEPKFFRDFVNRIELVRRVLIRPEDPERAHVEFHYVAQKLSQYLRVFCFDATRILKLDCISSEVRQAQVLFEYTAVGVWIRAHATVAGWSQITQFFYEVAFRIEESFGLVTMHPLFEQFQMSRV